MHRHPCRPCRTGMWDKQRAGSARLLRLTGAGRGRSCTGTRSQSLCSKRCVHTGPSLGSTSQPSPAQPSCVIHPIALCVHVLLSAVRRSSHQGAMRNRPHGPNVRYLSFLHVDTLARPVSSHPTPIVSLHRSQDKVQRPPPTSSPLLAARGVVLPHLSIPAVSTRLVTLPAFHTLLLPPPATRPRVQSTHGRATWATVQQLSSHL